MNEEEKKDLTNQIRDMERNIQAMWEDINYLIEKYHL